MAPDNPDMVYVMQTSLYRSTDGGKTFVSFKGAPGGDDYHVLWIDPANGKRMVAGVDQGPTISLDGGTLGPQLVQLAERSVLPHHHGHAVPVLDLRHAAG